MLPDDQLAGQCDDFQAAKPDAFGVGEVLLRVATDDVVTRGIFVHERQKNVFDARTFLVDGVVERVD